MGYSIARALRIRDSAQMQLRYLYSRITIYGVASSEVNKRKLDIFENSGVNKAPQWVRSYLDGYWSRVMENCYEKDLVFGGKINGTFYSTHSDREDYYEKHGIGPCEYSDDGKVCDRGHYWKNNLKPFFISKHS